MKTPRQQLQNLLLAAAMTLTLGGVVQAAENDEGAAGPHGGQQFAADGEHGGGPGDHGDHGEHGGPGGPGEHGGPDGHGMPPSGMHGGPGMSPFGPMGGATPMFLHHLDLSEAQQDKVFAILHAQEPYLRDQGKAAAKAHEALRDMAMAVTYDDAKAAAQAQASAQAMANIALQQVRTQQKLLALLTPEQRKKLADGAAGKHEHQPARP